MVKPSLDMERLRQICLQMMAKGQLAHEEEGMKIRLKSVQAPQIDISGVVR